MNIPKVQLGHKKLLCSPNEAFYLQADTATHQGSCGSHSPVLWPGPAGLTKQLQSSVLRHYSWT